MKISLKPITQDNFYSVIELNVKDEQREFVAPNVFSISEASIYSSWQPMAVYDGEQPVGFVMWGMDGQGPDRHWWIIRLMVDQRYQGRGIGRRAMELCQERLSAAGAEKVFLSFEPENEAARGLYSSLGFADTGEIEDGESVWMKEFSQP